MKLQYSGFMTTTWLTWLADLMAKKEVNNKGLATLLGISPSTVGNWKDGVKPEADMIVRLAALAHQNAAELFALVYGVAGPDGDSGQTPRSQRIEELAEKIAQLGDDDQDELDALIALKLSRQAKR